MVARERISPPAVYYSSSSTQREAGYGAAGLHAMIEEQRNFNAVEELEKVRAAREVRRRRVTWGKSKLSKHRAELVKMQAAGGSLSDLVFWLRRTKRVKVCGTTVMRFLKKIPAVVHG